MVPRLGLSSSPPKNTSGRGCERERPPEEPPCSPDPPRARAAPMRQTKTMEKLMLENNILIIKHKPSFCIEWSQSAATCTWIWQEDNFVVGWMEVSY